MKTFCAHLSPDTPENRRRLTEITDFWNAWRCSDDSGKTTGRVLDELEAKVSDAIACDPVDLQTAESLTARAALKMAGFDAC